MELPDQITEIGAQLDAGGAITPDPELFETYEVFAAELTNLFVKPWLAADHASRLAADGDYFRVDIGGFGGCLERIDPDVDGRGLIVPFAECRCLLAAQPSYPAGVNVHRLLPVSASRAIVLPYVVVTTITL